MEKIALPKEYISRMELILKDEFCSFMESYSSPSVKGLRINPLKKSVGNINDSNDHRDIDNCKDPSNIKDAGVTNEFKKCFDIESVLLSKGIKERIPWEKNGFYYTDEVFPFGKSPLHASGAYYIQEPSAMLPVTRLMSALQTPENNIGVSHNNINDPSSLPYIINSTPPDSSNCFQSFEYPVLDLCAAPGGKSTQIAGYMGGKGLLVSNEIIPSRAKILSENMERLGITNALVCSMDPADLSGFFPCFFGRILVDAPCSGEGMFRKNPGAVNEWSPENVEICIERQRYILKEAAKMLLPGGRLVYSTCTFEERENEGNISWFLENHSDFKLIDMERIWPHKIKGEGHFCAVLEKEGTLLKPKDNIGIYIENTDNNKSKAKSKKKKLSAKDALKESALELWKDFRKKYLTGNNISIKREYDSEGQDTVKVSITNQDKSEHDNSFCATENAILSRIYDDESSSYTLFGDNLYLLPDGCPSLSGLKVLRPGLHLGTIKKDRFEPSHALALAIDSQMVKQSYNIDRESREASAFIHGESLPNTGDHQSWVLICVNGLSLGWGKASGNTIKNHYPRGLRF